jgi:hypothetical protein
MRKQQSKEQGHTKNRQKPTNLDVTHRRRNVRSTTVSDGIKTKVTKDESKGRKETRRKITRSKDQRNGDQARRKIDGGGRATVKIQIKGAWGWNGRKLMGGITNASLDSTVTEATSSTTRHGQRSG